MLTLSKADLADPCVYKVLDAKQRVLYVGCGASGMGRVFDISSDQKGRTRAFKLCDQVQIRFFTSKKTAEEIEAQLIHEFHPKYNCFCPRCNYYIKRRPKRLQSRGLLFGKTRSALLSLLFKNPEKAYYLREIASLTAVPVGAVGRELGGLARRGFVKRFSKGSNVFFQAEVAHPIFNELRSMVLKGA